MGSQDKKNEAIDLALETLDLLGEKFPRNPSKFHVAAAHQRVKGLLKGKSDDDLLGLPRMRNPQKVAAQQMLSQAYLYAVVIRENLATVFSFRIVELTIKFGLSAMSTMGFGVYSISLSR